MDAATIGVLRDVATLVGMAIALGAVAYNALQISRPAFAWNARGRVDVSHFTKADAGVAALLLVFFLAALWGSPSHSTEPATLSVWPLLANMVVTLSICIALLIYLRVIRGLNPAEIFGLKRLGIGRALGLACLFILPTLLLVNVSAANVVEWMGHFWPSDAAQDLVEGFSKSNSGAAKMLLAVTAVIVAPLFEEMLFRGLIYGVIKRYTDGYFAAICSALLFGTIHFHVGSLFPLSLLALIFCLVYELTGSLLVTMGMHALFNATSLVLLAFYDRTT